MRQLVCFFGKLFFCCKSKKIPKDLKKILIMRSGGVGDVLMSAPLVKAIRKHYKNAEITYFVGDWSKDILRDNSDIDKIFNYDDLIIIKRNIFKIFKLIKNIKKQKFDLCFNLEKSWYWSLLAFLFGIPARVGFNRKGEGFANTITVPFDGTKYELEYYLDLARLLNMKITGNDMEIYLTKEEINKASKFIEDNKLKNTKIIGIAPGGADNPGQKAVIKRWPLDRYIELIDNLDKKWNVVLFGGNNDIDTCITLKKKEKRKINNTAGKFTIKESAALMKHCKLFLTHDAGLMHIAAAVKVPLIALFGPTQAERFAPKNAIVIKSKVKPCYDIYGSFKKCRNINHMHSIDVKEVLKRIK